MVRHEAALRLSSTLAVKVGGAGDSWGRYVDNHVVEPDTRVVERDARLYVVFRVNECATPKTLRDLAIRASATWQREEVENRAREAARAAEREEERRAAEEKAAERRRHEEERQERLDAKAWRDGETAARLARERASSAPGDTADTAVQGQIQQAMERLGLQPCPEGYAYKRVAGGWVCGGGSHRITDEQLAAGGKH